MDEAMLAINIPQRSFGELLQPLDYNTSAPFPFLWLERAAVTLWGADELALRAAPTLAGLALLPLIGLAGRRLFGPAGQLAAILLAALSPTLIRFSNEVKPYGTDALLTALLLALGSSVNGAPQARRPWVALCAIAPLAVLCSYPGLFVACAVLAAALLVPEIRRPRARSLLLCALLCGLAFALPYFAIYRTAAGGSALQGAWEAAFLEPGPDLERRMRLALPGLLLPTFLGNGASIPAHTVAIFPVIAAILALGLVEAARRHGAWAPVLLAGPIAVAAFASSLRRYPFGVPRLMAFAAPALILMAAGAVAWAYARLRQRARPWFAAPLLLIAVLPTLRDDLAGVRSPFAGEDSRSLVAVYKRQRRGEMEPVYVSAKAIPAWIFYTTNWKKPKLDRLAFYAAAATRGLAFENRPSREQAVKEEGLDLVFEWRGRRELLGIGTGREWRWPNYTRPVPDEGWAANEARRIYVEAVKNPDNPCAWLFFTRLSERSNKPVGWILRDEYGGKLDFLETGPGAWLARYCFTSNPAT
ncbi:MAG: glycosyltransferase family 39 protein [Vicinamibacteria bacterium]